MDMLLIKVSLIQFDILPKCFTGRLSEIVFRFLNSGVINVPKTKFNEMIKRSSDL